MFYLFMMFFCESLLLFVFDFVKLYGEFLFICFFEFKIKIFDFEGCLGYSVFIVCLEIIKMVYVVESESFGLYVLCKLGLWVDVGEFSYDVIVVCKERLKGLK